MRMRWILEWKVDETTGDKKPKARIVVLGYMCRSMNTAQRQLRR